MAANPNRTKKKLNGYYNESAALAAASEASLPGVIQLVACTVWKCSPALVLKYHGQ